MKKKILMILTILISTVFLNNKVNAKTSGYYISAMYKEPELINKYSFNNQYGGYYSDIINQKTDIKFYFNNVNITKNEYIYVPITFYTTNANEEYNKNNNGIYNIEAGISVRALYSNGYMSSCYALEFNKNNSKIIYKCNINSGATNLNGFRIYINDLAISNNQLETISYIGVGDTLDLEKENSSTIIQNQEETNNILKQEKEYNKNESQSTQGQKQEIDNYEQEEDNLRNKLNLNIEDTEISVNPNANNFIWEVVNKLRTMSGKIVLLFTSVLSLGIMKMILGR